MRPVLLLAILALCTAGCAEQNLLGEEVWTDERLAQAEVGFGWNYDVEGEGAPSRNIDVQLQPDNSYQIRILEYRSEAEPVILDQTDGKLAPTVATRLRTSLENLRSGSGDLFTTMPDCPAWSHPAVEYYVGFEFAEKPTLTVIDGRCETPETLEGRRLVSEALAAFPQVDRTKLVAGSVDL